jgi:hypothetical protein
MQNIAGKRRAGQEGVDSDYLFGSFLRFPALRSTWCCFRPRWRLKDG